MSAFYSSSRAILFLTLMFVVGCTQSSRLTWQQNIDQNLAKLSKTPINAPNNLPKFDKILIMNIDEDSSITYHEYFNPSLRSGFIVVSERSFPRPIKDETEDMYSLQFYALGGLVHLGGAYGQKLHKNGWNYADCNLFPLRVGNKCKFTDTARIGGKDYPTERNFYVAEVTQSYSKFPWLRGPFYMIKSGGQGGVIDIVYSEALGWPVDYPLANNVTRFIGASLGGNNYGVDFETATAGARSDARKTYALNGANNALMLGMMSQMLMAPSMSTTIPGGVRSPSPMPHTSSIRAHTPDLQAAQYRSRSCNMGSVSKRDYQGWRAAFTSHCQCRTGTVRESRLADGSPQIDCNRLPGVGRAGEGCTWIKDYGTWQCATAGG